MWQDTIVQGWTFTGEEKPEMRFNTIEDTKLHTIRVAYEKEHGKVVRLVIDVALN